MHPNVSDEEEPSVDLTRLRERAAFTMGALRRNALPALLVALLAVGLGLSVAWLIPDRYKVETRLLAQRPELIASLSNPGRAPLAAAAGSPRSVVADLILRRDNLLSIIRQTDLAEHWRATRPPLFRLKDYLAFGRELSDQELTDVLAWTLEKRIVAQAQDGTVSISATWEDPVMAFRLADAAYRNFVETQNVNEMAMLGESITLLEERLVESQRSLDEALSAAKALPGYGRSLSAVAAPTAPRARPESVERVQLRREIAAKQRALEDLVTFRERRITELQAQLAEQRAVYAESHPIIINLKRSLEELSSEPAQLEDLKGQVAELESRYVQHGGTMAELLAGGPLPRAGSGAGTASLLSALEAPARGPAEEYARSRLTAAIVRYYNVADRLEAARIERDAARVGDKFRYLVVRPPLPPRKADNGTIKAGLTLTGILLAPVLAVLAALGLELRKGRISEDWQIERALGLPVVAELPARLR